MKRLSVILPGYKTPHVWWRRAIDSVLRALASEDELLCINDGDGEACFLETYVRQHSNVRVLHQPNRRQAISRNHGITLARGRWITFVDSDDWVEPEIYATMLAQLETAEADIGLFGVRSIWSPSQTVDILPPSHMSDATPLPLTTVRQLSDNYLIAYAWNKLYRKDFLERHRLTFHPLGMPCEDIAFNLHCLAHGATVSLLPRVGYNYNRHIGSSLTRYAPHFVEGLRIGQDAWQAYVCAYPEAASLFVHKLHRGIGWEAWEMWKNINAIGSPYTFKARVNYVKEHRHEMSCNNRIWRVLLYTPRLLTCLMMGLMWTLRLRLVQRCLAYTRVYRLKKALANG